MAIHEFKVTVTRTDEYHIKLDDEVINESYMEDFSESFGQVDSLEDVAGHLATAYMREVDSDFVEGYGWVKKFRKDGSHSKGLKRENGQIVLLTDEDYAKGLSIKIISEDFDYDTEIEKIS